MICGRITLCNPLFSREDRRSTMGVPWEFYTVTSVKAQLVSTLTLIEGDLHVTIIIINYAL